MATITISPYSIDFQQNCSDLIAALPDWFGIPEANIAYIQNLKNLPSWIAFDQNNVVGVATLEALLPGSFEIHFMAVDPNLHRQGIGRKLVNHLENEVRRNNGKWLVVKTLAASHPDPFYARTREFYYALGFTPLFESDAFWGPENPAIIMIKSLI